VPKIGTKEKGVPDIGRNSTSAIRTLLNRTTFEDGWGVLRSPVGHDTAGSVRRGPFRYFRSNTITIGLSWPGMCFVIVKVFRSAESPI